MSSPPAQPSSAPPVRRRWAAALFAVAVVLGVGLATTLSANAEGRAPGEFAEGRTSHRTAAQGIAPVATSVNGHRGYVIALQCYADADCRYQLWVTATGGQTWRGYATPLPAVNVATRQAPKLIPIGPDGLLLEQSGLRWFSNDHGRSWRWMW